MKFKPLLPSLKEKKRYLIFEIIGIKCSLEKIKIVILLNLHDFVGEYGLGLMGIIFLDDWQNNRGIIRVNNKYVDLLKASFVKIDKIDKERVIVKSVKTSGILKKARSYL
ncbi:MAG TPA: Rpp14/Pop5 family protein [Candidatus Nanoarchaeia archaeon]|nr:Rpp14/Pop5 family protein [Candidatus Nanoarchaeia archaeon]